MDRIIEEIKQERQRQDGKWGVQNHAPVFWAVILGEEYGEVCKAIQDHTNYREELIQVAAVALAAIECLDRTER
jgi:NTP pyrophosphatase (non-canonical NTP hydrolase)